MSPAAILAEAMPPAGPGACFSHMSPAWLSVFNSNQLGRGQSPAIRGSLSLDVRHTPEGLHGHQRAVPGLGCSHQICAPSVNKVLGWGRTQLHPLLLALLSLSALFQAVLLEAAISTQPQISLEQRSPDSPLSV